MYSQTPAMVTSGSRDPLASGHPTAGLTMRTKLHLVRLKRYNATRTAPIARRGPSSTPQLPQPMLQAPIHHNPRPRAARVWVGGRASRRRRDRPPSVPMDSEENGMQQPLDRCTCISLLPLPVPEEFLPLLASQARLRILLFLSLVADVR